ncbi:MAG: DNRLRE domain-containing protein, partial [Acidimicrobiales bacterium]|nr:DNRLRE domain-containing protein [Acidimicrobiales bacterium]
MASDLALMPAASAEAPKQVQLEVSAEAPTLDVKAGRKADPSRLAGLSSRVSIPSATPVPVGVEGPTPGTEQPEGWVAPGVRGYEEGRSGEDVKKTSATERVWENPDGTSTLELSSRPVRFRDRAGRWQDFDTDLVAVKGGGFQAKALPEGSNVAAAADAEAVVSAGTEAGIVSLAQPGAEAAQGRVDASGETVTFPDAIDGDSDLVVGLLPNGFETSVVVPDGAPQRASFEQVLTVPAGLVARNGSVGVEFVAVDGTVVGSYGSGVAWDAGLVEDEVEVRTSLVSQEGTEATVRVSVDPVWLAAPERVFPVTIDPVLSFSQNTGASGAMDTYVQSNIVNTPQSTATELKLGKAYGTSYIRRTLMKFDVSSLVGAGRVVTSANLSVANTYSPSCTGRAITVASLSGSFNASTL